MLCLAPPAARAEGAASSGDGWEQVDGRMMQPGETIPARELVGAAYAFIWVMVAGFVLTVWRRTEAVERELLSLKARIAEADAARKKKTAEPR